MSQRPKRLNEVTARIFVLAALAGLAGCARKEGPIGFNREIEPILSENCYQCHGPDPGGRKAGLRLDRAEYAFALHDNKGPAILPGDPDHSPGLVRSEE